MACGNVTVKYPGESPRAIWLASRSPRLFTAVLEIVVLPRGAKYVRVESIEFAHSTNDTLLLGIAASIGCSVSVGPEYGPAFATNAVSAIPTAHAILNVLISFPSVKEVDELA